MARVKPLSEEVKLFLVTQYAVFEKTADIIKAVKERYGLELEQHRVRRYDADYADHGIGKKYVAIFEQTRKDFFEEIRLQHPISQRAFRIKRLGQMAEIAFSKGNYALSANLMKQAAMETGGSFTNELNVKGKVAHAHSGTVETRSPDESRNLLADILSEALTRIPDKTVN